MNNILANRYAQALYDTASAKGSEKLLHEQLSALLKLIADNASLKAFLEHPRIDESMQKEITKTLFKKNFDELLVQFLNLLIQKKRLNLITDIIAAYDDIYCQKLNIVKAHIQSAVEISDAQLKKLANKLKHKLNKEIVTDVTIDPSLLGGFKINVNNQIMDYSITSQLKAFYFKIIHAY